MLIFRCNAVKAPVRLDCKIFREQAQRIMQAIAPVCADTKIVQRLLAIVLGDICAGLGRRIFTAGDSDQGLTAGLQYPLDLSQRLAVICNMVKHMDSDEPFALPFV